VRGVKLFLRRDDDVLDLFMDGVSFIKMLQYEKLKKADIRMKKVMENQSMAQDFFNKQSPEIGMTLVTSRFVSSWHFDHTRK
jgi:hypothetical protein